MACMPDYNFFGGLLGLPLELFRHIVPACFTAWYVCFRFIFYNFASPVSVYGPPDWPSFAGCGCQSRICRINVVYMKSRVVELDFLKCVFILLMIAFHLVYIGDKYSYAKTLVYTFHMPAFLIISGYLMNVEKKARSFLRMIFWIFVPYAVMESGYVVMSSVLPVRGGVDVLGWDVWLEKLFLHPVGPYWYLHTLMVCGLTYYAVYRMFAGRKAPLSFLIVLSLLYGVEASEWVGVVSLSNALYFLAGVALRRASIGFCSFFRPSWWAVLPFVWLASDMSNLDRSLLSGVALTYLSVSLSLALCRLLPEKAVRSACFIGSNTFILLVFSPIFTMLVKPLVPVFAFDPSGMLFLFVSLCVTVAGCFVIAWGMDRLHLSPFFWGKERMVQSFG